MRRIFFSREAGQTVVEFVVILLLIAIILVGVVTLVAFRFSSSYPIARIFGS